MPTGGISHASTSVFKPIATKPLTPSPKPEPAADKFQPAKFGNDSAYSVNFNSSAIFAKIQEVINTPFNLDNIKESNLHIECSLTVGYFSFQTHTDTPANIKIKPGTKILIDIETDVLDGHASIKSFNFSFSNRVTLYNPASSLSPATGNMSKLFNWAKDKICKFKIDGFKLDAKTGNITPLGKALCRWPFKDKLLSDIINAEQLPKLISNLSKTRKDKNLFEFKKPSIAELEARELRPHSDTPNFSTLLMRIIRPGFFSTNGRIFPQKLDALKNLPIDTPENVFFNLGGKFNVLEHGLNISLSEDSSHPTLKTTKGNAKLSGTINIEKNTAGDVSARGHVDFNASNDLGEVSLHTHILRNNDGLELKHGQASFQIYFPKTKDVSLGQLKSIIPITTSKLPSILANASSSLHAAKLESAGGEILFSYNSEKFVGKNGRINFIAKQKGFGIESDVVEVDVDFSQNLILTGCAANIDIEMGTAMGQVHSSTKLNIKGRREE